MSGSETLAAAVAALRANPFVGPRPLEKGQPIFGRDAEIDQLYYRLSAERILLFHSPSGAGKSSLLQAGLLPRLAAQFDVWAPARVSLPDGPADPGPAAPSGVNRYLRSCILSFEAEIPKDRQRPEASLVAQTLAAYVENRPRRRSAPGNVVLIFDQFEEILTVDPLAWEARREFFVQLGALLQNPRVWAVFALREDYLAQLDPFADFVPTHLKNRFRLDLLCRDAAEEAIAKSVATVGRSFAPDALTRLVSDLALTQVQQPGGDFRSEPGRAIEPLHLQVTCHGLWERLPADRDVIQSEDVSAFGNVTGALAQYYAAEVARAALASPDPESTERDIRLWCGERLITRGNIRAQILREPGASGCLDNNLIQALIDVHLVRAESRSSATWYELAHDRLIEPVHQDNARWFAAHLNLAQSRALEWQRNGEPEGLLLTGSDLGKALRWAGVPGRRLTPAEVRFLDASRAKRRGLRQRQAFVAGLMLLFVAALGLAAWALRERAIAEKNLRDAVVARTTAQHAYAAANRERRSAVANLALAEKTVSQAITSSGVEQGQEFSDVPAVEDYRRQILLSVAPIYSAMNQQNANDPALRMDAAWGEVYLADTDRLLGKLSEALSQYGAAIRQFQAIGSAGSSAASGAHPLPAAASTESSLQQQVQRAVAYCHNWAGETLRQRFEASGLRDLPLGRQAVEQYRQALLLQRPLHAADPANALYTQELARTLINLGLVQWDLAPRPIADTAPPFASVRKAIALLTPLIGPAAAQGPTTSVPPAEDLLRAENDLGTFYFNATMWPNPVANTEVPRYRAQARSLFDQTVSLATSLLARDPGNRAYLSELTTPSENEARLLLGLNNRTQAAVRNQQALAAIRSITDPGAALSLQKLRVLDTRASILITNNGGWTALDAVDAERLFLDSLGGVRFLASHPNAKITYWSVATKYEALALESLENYQTAGNLQIAAVCLNHLQEVQSKLTPQHRSLAQKVWQEISSMAGLAATDIKKKSPQLARH